MTVISLTIEGNYEIIFFDFKLSSIHILIDFPGRKTLHGIFVSLFSSGRFYSMFVHLRTFHLVRNERKNKITSLNVAEWVELFKQTCTCLESTIIYLIILTTNFFYAAINLSTWQNELLSFFNYVQSFFIFGAVTSFFCKVCEKNFCAELIFFYFERAQLERKRKKKKKNFYMKILWINLRVKN